MKLIHCADIHLDSPMQTHMTARQAATRSAEVLRSFVRMTQYARENGVRAVIIAGDLFDGDRVRERTVDAVLDAMQKTPEDYEDTLTYRASGAGEISGWQIHLALTPRQEHLQMGEEAASAQEAKTLHLFYENGN